MRPLIALIIALALLAPAGAQAPDPVRVARVGPSPTNPDLWTVVVYHSGGAALQIDCEAGGTRTTIDTFRIFNRTDSVVRSWLDQRCPDGGQLYVGMTRWTGAEPPTTPLAFYGPWPVPYADPVAPAAVSRPNVVSLPLVTR